MDIELCYTATMAGAALDALRDGTLSKLAQHIAKMLVDRLAEEPLRSTIAEEPQSDPYQLTVSVSLGEHTEDSEDDTEED